MTDKPTPTAAVREMIEAAKAYLEKTEAVFSSSALLSVMSVADIHNCPYNGPTINGEDQTLRQALAALPDLAELCVVPKTVVSDAALIVEGNAARGYFESELAPQLRECLT